VGKSNSNNKTVTKTAKGRPTKYNPEKIALLVAAFANSFTVEQACHYAEISKVTFYDWIEKHDGFSEQMERAKSQVGMKAKQVVVGAVNKGDVETSKWWLKNKHSDEFGGNASANVTVNFNNYSTKQREVYDI
jgi:hypothetical protein